eukprot:1384864-Amorphochlora_amoeboformis.AAC.1
MHTYIHTYAPIYPTIHLCFVTPVGHTGLAHTSRTSRLGWCPRGGGSRRAGRPRRRRNAAPDVSRAGWCGHAGLRVA